MLETYPPQVSNLKSDASECGFFLYVLFVFYSGVFGFINHDISADASSSMKEFPYGVTAHCPDGLCKMRKFLPRKA